MYIIYTHDSFVRQDWTGVLLKIATSDTIPQEDKLAILFLVAAFSRNWHFC